MPTETQALPLQEALQSLRASIQSGALFDMKAIDALNAFLAAPDPAPECFCVEHGLHIETLKARLAELESSVREFLRVDSISVDGSAARNKALVALNTALSASAEPSAPVEREEQEEFEEWAKGQGMSITRTPNPLCFINGTRRAAGDYIDLASLCSFAAWKARATMERKP